MDTAELKKEAIALRKEKHQMIKTALNADMKDGHDLAIVYTPGVSAPCLEIKKDEDLSLEMTWRGNVVAVISDGTRVLGLGDIGAAAAMPVMEGKSALYKRFGNIDAIPIVLDTKDKDEFIHTVKLLEKNFAGINLEDISSPKCYDIEDELKKIMNIPVFHDDQHGTAIAALAALLGALKVTGKKIDEIKVVMNGAGAAGTAIARLLLEDGVKPENMTILNSKGILYDNGKRDRVQRELIKKTNPENKLSPTLSKAQTYSSAAPLPAYSTATPSRPWPTRASYLPWQTRYRKSWKKKPRKRAYSSMAPAEATCITR